MPSALITHRIWFVERIEVQPLLQMKPTVEGNFLFVTGREVKEEAGLEPGGLELLEADLADTTKKLAQIKIWIAGIEKELADEPEPVWRQIGRS